LSAKILPRFSEKARYYQLESQLKQALGVQ